MATGESGSILLGNAGLWGFERDDAGLPSWEPERERPPSRLNFGWNNCDLTITNAAIILTSRRKDDAVKKHSDYHNQD